MNIINFFEKFDLKIKNISLYEEALTHNSYANEKRLKYTYQRLEFLGDAILEAQTSLYIFEKFKNVKEGMLTKYRSKMVREETLSELSSSIGLGKMIFFGKGEIISKGWEKPSILADVYEATLAAIFLDLGLEAANKWLNKTLFKLIEETKCFFEEIIDAKSELQELLQSENKNNLKYVVEKQVYNEEKNQIEYTISVFLDDVKFGTGKGFSKQQAEQQAARDCFKKIAIK